jgi:TGF-beta propeptide
LVFQFTESQKVNNLVALATLNIFVHSKNYLKSIDAQNANNIDIEISKVLQKSPHKRIFEKFQNVTVPDSTDGEFMQFNITKLVSEWFSSHEISHVMAIKIINSKTGDVLPHKVLSLETEKFATVSMLCF